MTKVKTSVVFKQYSPQQNLLVPPSLKALINKDHLVWVVNEMVELMDIGDLINLYKGGGTGSYHAPLTSKTLFLKRTFLMMC